MVPFESDFVYTDPCVGRLLLQNIEEGTMKRVMVTGGAGFWGRIFVNACSMLETKCYAWIIFSPVAKETSHI